MLNIAGIQRTTDLETKKVPSNNNETAFKGAVA